MEKGALVLLLLVGRMGSGADEADVSVTKVVGGSGGTVSRFTSSLLFLFQE